jgi:hypothetical protein
LDGGGGGELSSDAELSGELSLLSSFWF